MSAAAAAAGVVEGEVSIVMEELAPLPIVPVSAQEARTRIGAVLEEVKVRGGSSALPV